MKYIVRIIILPFWATSYLIFALYLTFVGVAKLCYGFVVYGGEQITYNHQDNKNTIFQVYQKLEQMEESFKIDQRMNCDHVWEQQNGYGSTALPKQKCVICGVEFQTKTF